MQLCKVLVVSNNMSVRLTVVRQHAPLIVSVFCYYRCYGALPLHKLQLFNKQMSGCCYLVDIVSVNSFSLIGF